MSSRTGNRVLTHRRHKAYPTIDSTYGRVTIFKSNELKVDETAEAREKEIDNIHRKFYENINQVAAEQIAKEVTPRAPVIQEDDGTYDFYGLKIEDDYEKAKRTEATVVPSNTTIDSNEKVNYIDEAYFSKNRLDTNATTTTHVSKDEIDNDNGLNFIDSNIFQQTNEEEGEASIPFVANTELTQAKINVLKQLKTRKQHLEHSQLLKEKERESGNVTIDNHKNIDEETPKWYKMTMDEAADLLLKHICHFNINHGILAIDKPYGLPSFGGPGVHLSVAKLVPILKKRLKIDHELYMMHRLDENTTGVMMFATNKDSEMKIRSLFNERKVIKQYLALTKNIPKPDEGEIDIPLIEREVNGINKMYLSPNYDENTKYFLDKPKGDNPRRHNAITKYRVLDANYDGPCALVECQPLTGLKHQLRVHLSFGLDCPILGDHKYSHHLKLAPQKLSPGMLQLMQLRQSKVRHVPMHLHAYRIILPEFSNNQNVTITAKLPLHFLKNLKRLKLRLL